MPGQTTVFAIVVAYMALLFVLARWSESRASAGGTDLADNAFVYSFSLAIYCSAWTFYGNVGVVSSSGLLFLTQYIGPTLAFFLWRVALRKMIAIKSAHQITSIADFISARYERSSLIAAIATIGAVMIYVPYAALQIKSVIATFSIVTGTRAGSAFLSDHINGVTVVSMIVFTIFFGVRRIQATESHPGIVVAVAVQSMVKLFAFLVAGIFITYGLFDGLGDIFRHTVASAERMLSVCKGAGQTTTCHAWTTYLVLSIGATFFLPRQFHVAVVENRSESHLRTAAWLFPLYLFLITIFVVPISFAGQSYGFALGEADTFVLRLPLVSGRVGLAVLVFIGGFSAAMSMVMIDTMAVATMVSNHLLLPLVQKTKTLDGVKHYILQSRWATVTALVLGAYAFQQLVGDSLMLANIGILSFAGALQFAPAMIAGLFWRRASRTGATLGLAAGLIIWGYTMLVPAFARIGLLPAAVLQDGPSGVALLRPEGLLGMDVLDPVSHAVFWSMLANISFLIVGSLLRQQSEEERQIAASFVVAPELVGKSDAYETPGAELDIEEKRAKLARHLAHYFPPSACQALLESCMQQAGIAGQSRAPIAEVANFVNEVRRMLAGSFGAAMANAIVAESEVFAPGEVELLRQHYSEILARMGLEPEELAKRIDYHQEKEHLLTTHAHELESKVAELDREIAERRRIEEELRQAEEKYRGIFENAIEGIFQSTVDGKYLNVNPAMARIFGYETCAEFIDSIDDIASQIYVDPAVREQFLSSIKEGKGYSRFEANCRRKDAGEIWILTNARGVFDERGELQMIEGLVQDITERKRMEQEKERFESQLRQAQKMEAIGTLAGGIAHDFNNLLMGIQGNVSLMLYGLGSEDPQYERLRSVERLVESGASLCAQLLGYARKGPFEMRAIDVNQLVDETAQTIRRTRRDVSVEVKLARDLSAVSADRSQLQQVLLNLLINAADAMPRGGIIEMRTYVVSAEEAERAALPPGSYLALAVADSGVGIPKEDQERIFEPFYTTKDRGRGTGLGLASVYGIVSNHGGKITVRSTVGVGTTFTVYLKTAAGEVARTPTRDSPVVKGAGTVLIVDDEYVVLDLEGRMLRKLGYAVLSARNGVEAVALFGKECAEIDLVVLDMVMPGMSGSEVFTQIKAIKPTVKVLLATGYSLDLASDDMLHNGCDGYLQKPFGLAKLSKKIIEILGPRDEDLDD